jgi:hypothetical protein
VGAEDEVALAIWEAGVRKGVLAVAILFEALREVFEETVHRARPDLFEFPWKSYPIPDKAVRVLLDVGEQGAVREVCSTLARIWAEEKP